MIMIKEITIKRYQVQGILRGERVIIHGPWDSAEAAKSFARSLPFDSPFWCVTEIDQPRVYEIDCTNCTITI